MKLCKNLSKSLKGNFRCKLYKRDIDIYVECKNCLNFILVKNKAIKKVSKKRIKVKDEIYDEVYKRDKGRCRLCGSANVQLHHIIYRSEDKSKINDVSNCIMLCTKHHAEVHSNKKYWQQKLKDLIDVDKIND